MPTVLCEGTGEANRAVEAALGRGLPEERPLLEPGDDDIGTGRGREDEAPSRGVDMTASLYLGGREGVDDGKNSRFLSHSRCSTGKKMTGSGERSI